MLKRENGITLVALVITIIILVILAAVSIVTVLQSNMINYAENGVKRYNEAQYDEKAIIDQAAEKMSSILDERLKNLESTPAEQQEQSPNEDS